MTPYGEPENLDEFLLTLGDGDLFKLEEFLISYDEIMSLFDSKGD